MAERTKRKLNKRGGFTLSETLLAILILLLAATIVATGIPAARSAYERVVLASNAEVLLSTAISSLRNELGTAKNIVVLDADGDPATGTGASLTYYSATRSASSKISLEKVSDKATAGNTIMLQRYAQVDGVGKDSPAERLISKEASTGDLYVTYTGVSFDPDESIITITGLSVDRESGSTNLASRPVLSIRVISK